MKLKEGQDALAQQELKCGDLVKYRLYDNQVYSTNAIFLRKFLDTRRVGEEFEDEPVEMHEIYLFDTATCENVFGFELEGVLNK
jgi:hypothetical protein